MPSWLWVIILLLIVAAIVVGLMWYVGVFAALDQRRPLDDEPGSHPTVSSAPEAPPRRAPRPPSPTAVPPPALAGPPRSIPEAAAEPAAHAGDPLPAPGKSSRTVPPAAPAGKSNASKAPANGKPVSKPPPAQALLSTSGKSPTDSD